MLRSKLKNTFNESLSESLMKDKKQYFAKFTFKETIDCFGEMSNNILLINILFQQK